MATVDCVEAFVDNYFWIIRDDRHAAVVDPGDATPVMEYLEEHQLQLTHILLTHHHADHIGGADELVEIYSPIVIGKPTDRMPALSQEVDDGDTVKLDALNVELKVLATPGHTLGHVCYTNDDWLFCGDTLFSGGCGRLFEGTPQQMHDSLKKLREQCPTQLVYCAHEYTEANYRFATHIDPHNETVAKRLEAVTAERNQGHRTIPSMMKIEKETNPFLRFDDESFINALNDKTGQQLSDPVEVFALTRKLKDSF